MSDIKSGIVKIWNKLVKVILQTYTDIFLLISKFMQKLLANKTSSLNPNVP